MPDIQQSNTLSQAHDNDDRQRLAMLKRTWGMDESAPLIVIGQLIEVEREGGGPLYFLEQLEEPETGRPLLYPAVPSGSSGASTAFVTGKDARRIIKLSDPESDVQWAMGELELSPLKEREKHKNPDECSVRVDSLRALSELPENWHIAGTDGIEVKRLAASVRHAVEANIRNTLSQHVLEYERQAADAQEHLRQISMQVLQSDQRSAEAEEALKNLQNTTIAAKKNFLLLQNEFERERAAMEKHIESLTELVRSKGERLVSLALLDEQIFLELLPKVEDYKVLNGLSLDQALDGDFLRLAALLQARLKKKNMIFSQAQLQDFLALVRTSDFVILAGDSGAGKSSLVKSVASSIGARCTVIAVKPNWTGPEDLLGYFNPIERNYQTTPFLQALLAASKEPDVLHFILLDEMNLARVEHYFADFLSLLETRERNPEIPLFTSDEARHVIVENSLFLSVEAEARLRSGLPDDASLEDLLKDETANNFLHLLGGFQNSESVLLHHSRLRRSLAALVNVPQKLTFPPNVRIVGAINVDDTTYDLSPKVLDRVHVMRFGNPLLADWDALEAEIEDFDEAILEAPLHLSPEDFGMRAEYPAFDRRSPMTAWLTDLAKEYLGPLGIEFGLRTLRQSLGYLVAAKSVGMNEKTALNNVVLHKILPKITLDLERIASNGRQRRDILIDLRNVFAERLPLEELGAGADSCVARLDRLIALADQNNGIANYWFR